MRSFLIFSLLGIVAATPALAQAPDRYSGSAAYPTQPQAVQAQPERVLTWPGKTMPSAQAPQVGGYVYQPSAPAPQGAPYRSAPANYYPPTAQRYAPAQAYPRRPQPAQAASYPSGLRAQPYYAPAPAAPAPAPGSTATAPNGVYPPNTVPPGYAYPQAVPPQMAAPLVGAPPPQPASIYAPSPAPQAKAPQTAAPAELNGQTNLGGQARPNPTDPHLPQRLAMNTADQAGARLYSLHREFGLQPDPTPAAAPVEGQAVELTTPIDSGGPPDPDADDDRPRTRTVTTANGKTTIQMRGSSSASTDN